MKVAKDSAGNNVIFIMSFLGPVIMGSDNENDQKKFNYKYLLNKKNCDDIIESCDEYPCNIFFDENEKDENGCIILKTTK